MTQQLVYYMAWRQFNLQMYKRYWIVTNLVATSNQNWGYKASENTVEYIIIIKHNILCDKQSNGEEKSFFFSQVNSMFLADTILLNN